MSMLWILLNYAEIFGQSKKAMISLEETMWHSFNPSSVNKLHMWKEIKWKWKIMKRKFCTERENENLKNTSLINSFTFSSVQFSRSVMSDSLQPHELQHARRPCPSPLPGVHSNSGPSSRWCHPFTLANHIFYYAFSEIFHSLLLLILFT